MSTIHYDIVQLGGGCSALHFSMQFAKTNLAKTVGILERKDSYSHDRNWSFFLHNNCSFEYDGLIKKKWQKWNFSAEAIKVSQNSNDFYYATIQSKDFYRKAQEVIQEDKRQTLHLSAEVIDVTWSDVEELFFIESAQGIITAKEIIDSRNQRARPAEISNYFQVFFGYEVELKTDFFDATSVDLMSHMKSFETGMSFVYTLPFSSKTALIEYTLFTNKFVRPETLEIKLREYLKELFQEHYYVIDKKEFASLPMGKVNFRKPVLKNYHRIGAEAGNLSESSGFGFLRLLEVAKSGVSSLERTGQLRFHDHYPYFRTLLDRQFIKTIERLPQFMPEIFMNIAKNLSAENFARFMNGAGTLTDLTRIIYAVPKLPFIKAIVNYE